MAEPTNAQRNPLLIQEILLIIQPMLSHQDILSCHRVCRIWNQAFFPSFLWESFRIQDPSIVKSLGGRYPEPDIIQRNAGHIRKLVCRDIRIIQCLIPECCHLEELDVYSIGSQVATLLRQNTQSLKKVSLSVSIGLKLEHQSMKRIFKALAECVHVEQCELVGVTVPDDQIAAVDEEDEDEDNEDIDEVDIIQEFYKVARDIPHLKISCPGIKKPPVPVLGPEAPSLSDSRTDTSSMAARQYASPSFIPQLPKLQSLSLNESKMSFLNQVRLLQHCHLELVDLAWNFVSRCDPSIPLVDTLHFQFLKLTTLCMEQCVLNDRQLAMILRAMPSLTRLRLRKTQIGRLSMAVIVGHALPTSFGHGVVPPTSSQDPSSQGLRRQLVELDVGDCPAVGSQDVLKVLQTCRKLKVLKAPRIAALDIVQQSDFWVCLGLEELHVGIIEVCRLGSSDDDQRRILHQIGQLTMLQTLSMITNLSLRNGYWGQKSSLDFTMDTGLDELWNLKELKVFAVDDKGHRAGMEELKWVKDNWAKYQLQEVVAMRRPDMVTVAQWELMKAYTDLEIPHVTFRDWRPKDYEGNNNGTPIDDGREWRE
ncbi:MAG: hypothetical protein J3Q66DRAFT_408967 [Benniella sp.]|nr:MAG: hypothetical protein J3Q66DRAFT_408967 [Benniella sp.]